MPARLLLDRGHADQRRGVPWHLIQDNLADTARKLGIPLSDFRRGAARERRPVTFSETVTDTRYPSGRE